ncbi:alanine racemase [Rhodoluna lacicola]|uniref:Alanine racemase n=1 Tax=Rhodoluna lacicola TaxID=529884 RepID=A0A060JHG9_9MICO|nr:alanine racemase [Rhodoluna lacicola]AIC47997.1 alanine racemase [Rhodoluna lacicola]
MRELIIDLDAIAKNLNTMRAKTNGALALAVIKADAYGHGMLPVAKKLEAAGADYLGVADIEEAMKLRAEGIDLPILAWLHSPTENFVSAIDAGIELGIANIDHLERIAKASQQLRRVARVHLKVDTGLGRNGAGAAEWPEVLQKAHELVAEGFIQVVAIFSHLSCTSEADDLNQIARFEAACDEAKAAGIDFELRHLVASDGLLRYPQAHYEMVRIGVALYGLSPFVENSAADFGLVPAMTATARVTQTKRVGANQGVSYGYLHRTAAETTLALIPVGYAEGLPRNATGKAQVSIHGKQYSVNSRVAMDQFVLDVGDDAVVAGDLVTIFGDPAAGVPSADDLAAACDTINYEIVTRMGGRFHRSYLGESN